MITLLISCFFIGLFTTALGMIFNLKQNRALHGLLMIVYFDVAAPNVVTALKVLFCVQPIVVWSIVVVGSLFASWTACYNYYAVIAVIVGFVSEGYVCFFVLPRFSIVTIKNWAAMDGTFFIDHTLPYKYAKASSGVGYRYNPKIE